MEPTTSRSQTVDRGRVDDALLDHLKERSAAGSGDRIRLDVVIPFSGEVLASLPEASGDDVRAAVRRARAAQPAWAALSYRERARRIVRLHDLVLKRQKEVMDLIQLETGKSRGDAFEEVGDVALVARYYAYHGERHVRSRRRRGLVPLITRTWEHQRPVGVVGFIAPWNYPLTLALSDAIPALLAGNGTVVKPDPKTPFSALWAARLLDEAGVPPDLFQVVPGDGARIGADLIGAVDHLAFTGSTKTGRIVAEEASRRLIGCSLELGGKNAMIVLDDADLDHAVEGAVRGCFSGAGQLCISLERILVDRSRFDDFLARFAEAAGRLRVGPGVGFDMDMGSLVSEDQLRRVEDHLRDALEKGATLVAGGRPLPELGPWFFAPTILTDVKPGMKLYDEETFGPVIAVYPYETEDEAVERVNDTRYGLNAAIFGDDVGRARRLAARLEVGTVNINEPYGSTWGSVDAPIGGVKQSGLGRRHGAEGILRFTEPLTVSDQRWIPLGPTALLPPRRLRRVITAAFRLLRRVPILR